MTLHLDATVEARNLEVTLDVESGQTVAILGPNGAGKSTVLSLIAGILRADSGHATLDDITLFDTGSNVFLAPHERGTGLLAQDPLLFPHLHVLDNVAFGPRSAGASRAASRDGARNWLAEVDATALSDRKPAGLSGGQAQRVAIARALAAQPRLLLLDEPMAALDITAVPAMRQLLRRVLHGRSSVIVTHDVLDALLLADHVIVMEDGRIVERGPTKDVLARPRSAFGAGIAGLNLARGRADGDTIRTDAGLVVSGLTEGPALAAGTLAVAVFSPGSVSVHRERPTGSPRNVFAATIRELEPRGSQIRIQTDEVAADVTASAVAELDLIPGTAVFLAVKASEVSIYPA